MSTLPPGLMDAFWVYETALMDDDLAAMERLFAPGPETLRGDADGLAVGHEAIVEFQRRRGGAPRRRIVEVHVRRAGPDQALVVAVTEPDTGGRGQQTQLWRHGEDGWQVEVAHVSGPLPALDRRVWRIVGDPLVAGRSAGPLARWSVAVKDLYAVAGHPRGAGNPTWLEHAAPETQHAAAVEAFLAAGADVRGITRTDEFAYSLAGTNHHYGTPPNPRAPGRISGGSSNGSASAVALGQVRVGLGTDTGGSVRVPAAYQGLWGIRTTHGAVSRAGLLPLAPDYDTVGWLTRSASDLAAVGEVLLPPCALEDLSEVVMVPELLDLATDDVAQAVRTAAETAGAVEEHWDLAQLPAWRQAFTLWQAYQAWECHGGWLADRMHTLGDDVRSRFEMASQVSADQAAEARSIALDAGEAIRSFVAGRVVVVPSASSVAPRPRSDQQAVREATLRLTCLAGLGGLPAVSIPVTTAAGLPTGACLLAAPGRDRDLLDLAISLATIDAAEQS